MSRGTWIFLLILGACAAPVVDSRRAGDRLPRQGDEIVVCGQLFHTGTRVVLWTDPGGFDAYRPHRHLDEGNREPTRGKGAARYGTFRQNLPASIDARVRQQGWSLDDLSAVVRQIVVHYDAAGTSARCFEILHDVRGLSAHFMLDTDGTIYQTLDCKERAWHAGPANDVSVGIEIANRGAYADRSAAGEGPVVEGKIHDTTLYQTPFTDEQYAALAKLCVALTRVLPRIQRDFPRDDSGRVIQTVLARSGSGFEGILGHYHVTRAKVDPGPAFDWARFAAQMKEVE